VAHRIEELIGLLGVVALLAWAARAAGLPYPVVLVAGGLGIGYLPALPEITIDPDVVFLVFVPPLVHAAGYRTSPRRLREEAPCIALLAIGLVGLTIAAVAVVAHALLDELTWTAAVTLGAIVAPTDPVAATSAFRRAGVPERIVSIVEGESLVNDGSALVAYRLAVAAAVTGSFSVLSGAWDLVSVSVGGVAIGLIVGWVSTQLRRRLDDSLIEITITLLTPYLAYIAAEELGVSGILAAVVSGIYVGSRANDLFSPGTRLEAYAFWNTFIFLLESTLFILIGLEFPKVLDGASGSFAVAALAVCAVVIALRMAFVLAMPGLRERERLVVGWAGMRGAVSLAAALAIPRLTDAGQPFPGRDAILFLTMAVIAATLVGQGLTLPALVRWAVPQPEGETDARRRALARFEAVQQALERISEIGLEGGVPPSLIERARELYTQRASQLAGECRTGVAEEDTDTAAWLRLRLELIEVERRALRDLRDQGVISNAVLADVERDLDLEASRLESRLVPA
jgi:CPA1 family monovalent cation:H+ antiporter